jgi:phosphatidylserine decarboxylase
MTAERVLIFDPKLGRIVPEDVFRPTLMNFLFGSRLGFLISEGVLKHKAVNQAYGRRLSRRKSRDQIAHFIARYGINTDEVAKDIEHFSSFNEFFSRELKAGARSFSENPGVLCSTADSRVVAFRLVRTAVFPVKGRSFSAEQLLGDTKIAERYHGGTCMVLRLAPADYHRFHYIDDGQHFAVKSLPGFYRAVSPMSLRHMKAVFTENRRDVTLLDTEHFGTVAHVDVGAIGVGHIHQRFPEGRSFKRGEEKGHFAFGGSTIIQLFESGRVKIDESILEFSSQGIETRLLCGNRLGEAG